jgi:hypothetical protein
MRRLAIVFCLLPFSLVALLLLAQSPGSMASRIKAPAANVSYLTGSASLSWTAIAANTCVDNGTTITVTGAADGDVPSVGLVNASHVSHVTFEAYVSATNTVKVRACNVATAASGAISASTVKVGVIH